MDDAEKMILENMEKKINKMNDNIIYLCGRSANAGARLANIEKAMKINDENTDLYGKQISEIKGRLMAVSAFIAIFVSCIISVLV